jgi:hypothetical protein
MGMRKGAQCAEPPQVKNKRLFAPLYPLNIGKKTGEVYLGGGEMKALLTEWRILEEKWKRNDSYGGKTESEWSDEQSRKRTSEKARRSLGLDDDESYPGKKELDQLSRGIVEKKKEEKPFCEPGNPWRNEDGEFTDPTKAKGSMSSGFWSGKKGNGCRTGKMRRSSANRSTQMAKGQGRDCGRLEKDNPNKKAQFRCKDGSAIWENEGSHYRIHKEDLKGFLLDEMSKVFRQLDEDFTAPPGSRPRCMSYKDFLIAVDNLNKSLKGELRTPPRK